MNTSTIAPVLPAAVNPSARTGDMVEPEAGAPSFSQVLQRQHASGHSASRTEAEQASEAGRHKAAGRRGQSAAPGREPAEQAADAGLSLPQLALELASHSPSARGGDAAAGTADPRSAGRAALEHQAGTQKVLVDGAALEAGQNPVAEESAAARFAVRAASETAGSALPGREAGAARPARPDGRAAQSRAALRGDALDNAAQSPGLRSTDASAIAAGQGFPATLSSAGHTAGSATSGAAASLDVAAPGALPSTITAGLPQFTTASGSAPLSAPLHSAQWQADFGQQVVMLVQNKAGGPLQTAELRLDPPELGPLRITINLNDNVAHAVFATSHASVRSAIENALPQLQQQLAQAGISLGQTSVNDQGAGQQQPSSEAFQAVGRESRGDTVSTAAAASTPVARPGPRSPDALVDTFA